MVAILITWLKHIIDFFLISFHFHLLIGSPQLCHTARAVTAQNTYQILIIIMSRKCHICFWVFIKIICVSFEQINKRTLFKYSACYYTNVQYISMHLEEETASLSSACVSRCTSNKSSHALHVKRIGAAALCMLMSNRLVIRQRIYARSNVCLTRETNIALS